MNKGYNGFGDKGMNRLLKTLLFWTLILGACSPGISSPQTLPATDPTLTPFPPSDITTTKIPLEFPTAQSPNPKFIATVSTPHIDPGPNGELPNTATEISSSVNECGYQWAYEDTPELSAQFDKAVKDLIPASTSHVTAFGENCINNDGQVVRFLVMETDFYVTASVETLDDYETFGNWLAHVMQVVNGFPPDLIAGSKSGFVEFRFEKNATESISFRVLIQQYNETAYGRTGEELFRFFYTLP
jgi:hypothetical protein